jgi:hypothetical protein
VPPIHIARLNHFQYTGGLENWLPNSGMSSPNQWASLWPLDPLGGATNPPEPLIPSDPLLTTAPAKDASDQVPRLSPSLNFPLNQPYEFSTYAEPNLLDPQRSGLFRLVTALGYPLAEVKAALSAAGFPMQHLEPAVTDADAATWTGLRYVLLSDRHRPLIPICSATDQRVIGFAHRNPTVPRPPITQPPKKSWWKRWLAKLPF